MCADDAPSADALDDALETLRNGKAPHGHPKIIPCTSQASLLTLFLAAQTPARQRKVNISRYVDTVCDNAFEHGLEEWALEAVVDLVSAKTELDQTSITTLIKNLYPAARVQSRVVVTVVGALGQGRNKPSPGSQALLLKWLIVILDVLEEPGVVGRLYGVLFAMLDMISLRLVTHCLQFASRVYYIRLCAYSCHCRTPLCHLLALITRRKHVRPFRIQQLYA